jgi:hypothetical protein
MAVSNVEKSGILLVTVRMGKVTIEKFRQHSIEIIIARRPKEKEKEKA